MDCRLYITIASLLTLVIAGCGRTDSTSRGSAATQPTLTPSQTIQHMHDLRFARQYGGLLHHIDPSQASPVVDFLLAMDALLAANSEVQTALGRYAPDVPAADFDLSALQHNQGLFSPTINVVTESVEHPVASVTIQIAGRVPLETVPMRRIEDRWVYWPEGEVGTVPRHLHNVARAMRKVARAIEHGATSEEQVREQFRLRISPVLRTLQSAPPPP
ncbi:MAG: hypothetical protein JXA69_14045 [Phycisphaerae bacterium]|nr:hypothetical protein [Phycisphaerae bacterium]